MHLIRAAWFCLLLILLHFLWNCASSVKPVEVAKVVEKHCPSEVMDPTKYREGAMQPNQAIRATNYWPIREANYDCRNRLLETAVANQRAAAFNAQQITRSFWDGVKWGVVVSAILVVVVVLL